MELAVYMPEQEPQPGQQLQVTVLELLIVHQPGLVGADGFEHFGSG